MFKMSLSCMFIMFAVVASSQSVGVGTASPNASAQLDISSNTKGILFPGMSMAQRDALTNPANGLHIFNTDEQGLNYYDSVNGMWNSYSSEHRTVVITIAAGQVFGIIQ